MVDPKIYRLETFTGDLIIIIDWPAGTTMILVE